MQSDFLLFSSEGHEHARLFRHERFLQLQGYLPGPVRLNA
jgi:hypothetical protein